MIRSTRFWVKQWSKQQIAYRTSTSSPTPTRLLRSFASAATPAVPNYSHQQFPSLILGPNKSLTPIGSFAENQAEFLQPDSAAVDAIASLLRSTNAGIVAHYYMDVELQGVLHAVSQQLPDRVAIADSLAMGDAALTMVQDHGASSIACLGVDFMSESVQAILHQYGHTSTPVYRLAQAKIGCSLAESAERESYRAWLQTAAPQNALHVVYINTSLATKAVSNSIVPTITCTSSNVLHTLLTAAAQIPSLDSIYYGPDTYMGDNLVTLLNTISTSWTDAEIAERLHPAHTRNSLAQLAQSTIQVYPHGNCVVHHMFGAAVVDTVREAYSDAYVTAHLEVPGEMFQIAMEYSMEQPTPRGVVGSTSDILKFITRTVQEAPSSASSQRLRFVLGTEAGMVTSILQKVQPILDTTQREVEIIFPVASEAVLATDDADVPLVPGVTGGDGCSTAGGCATCPYMKMNSLDSLTNVLELMTQDNKTEQLARHAPPNHLGAEVWDGRPAMEWATEPIQYMRALTQEKQLPSGLVDRIVAGSGSRR